MNNRILLYNGQIITVNVNDDIADAIIIDGNRILFVGNREDAVKLSNNDTLKIDLEGKAVVPGFIDAHIHMDLAGVPADASVSASRSAGVNSIEDIKAKVKKAVSYVKPGEWVMGNGYNQDELLEKRNPTRWDLDEVSPDNPVMLMQVGGHICVYNTRALEKGHLLDGMVQYPKEHVFMENGEISGVLKETAHFIMMEQVNKEYTDEIIIDGLKHYSRVLLSHGITTTHDAGGYGTTVLRTLQMAKETGELTNRSYPMLWSCYGKKAQKEMAHTMIKSGFYTGLGDEFLKKGPIKLMLDGGSSIPSCATREVYSHNGEICEMSFTQDEIEEIVINAHRAHFQITAHAIGDAAIEAIVKAYEKAQKLYPRKDARHRIEHCAICPPDLTEKIKDLGVIPVANPVFLSTWGSQYKKYFGDRVEFMFPINTYIKEGVIVAFGSDGPLVEINPLVGIASAMERKDLNTGEIAGEAEGIDILQAIRCYTYNGAYSSFEENIKGSLEAGKLADMVILSGEILGKTPFEIRELKVEKTILDGKIVYEKQ